jgi:hypothetical protein
MDQSLALDERVVEDGDCAEFYWTEETETLFWAYCGGGIT